MIGLAYGVTNPAAALILARHCPPERRNLVFSLKQTGVPLGGVVAGLLLPGITSWLGWQAALGVACAGGLALALVLLPSRAVWDEGRSPVRLSPAAVIGSLRAVWAMPALRALAMATFCYAAMQLTLMSFAVILLVGEVGWSLLAAGAAFSAMQATGAAGRVLWGAVADRLGRSAWVLSGLGFVSAGAAILTAGLGPDSAPGWVLAVLLLFAATAIGWNGVFLAEVARIGGPEGAGRTTGAVMVFTFSGVVIGPALYSGVFWLAGSHGAAMGLMAAFPILGSLLVLRGAGVSSQPRVAL
jgi:MFS family permease